MYRLHSGQWHVDSLMWTHAPTHIVMGVSMMATTPITLTPIVGSVGVALPRTLPGERLGTLPRE